MSASQSLSQKGDQRRWGGKWAGGGTPPTVQRRIEARQVVSIRSQAANGRAAGMEIREQSQRREGRSNGAASLARNFGLLRADDVCGVNSMLRNKTSLWNERPRPWEEIVLISIVHLYAPTQQQNRSPK